MFSPICTITIFLCFIVSSFDYSWSLPAHDANLRSKRSVDVDNPEDVFRVLFKLAQDVIDSDNGIHSDKRGIDLGLSRGFSGSQAAKHL
ncbi:diuretic hormone class 2-like, partial [Uloborus diversus]